MKQHEFPYGRVVHRVSLFAVERRVSDEESVDKTLRTAGVVPLLNVQLNGWMNSSPQRRNNTAASLACFVRNALSVRAPRLLTSTAHTRQRVNWFPSCIYSALLLTVASIVPAATSSLVPFAIQKPAHFLWPVTAWHHSTTNILLGLRLHFTRMAHFCCLLLSCFFTAT